MSWYLVVFISWKGFTITPVPSGKACEALGRHVEAIAEPMRAKGVVTEWRCVKVKP